MNMKVLVLDDEKLVRDILEQLLRHLGHEATVAMCGEDAIATYGIAIDSGRPFDAVIVDLNLDGEGMDGRQTARRLLELDPAASLILSTGSLQDPVVTNFSEHGFVASLRKPYRLEHLVSVLNSVALNNDITRRNTHVQTS